MDDALDHQAETKWFHTMDLASGRQVAMTVKVEEDRILYSFRVV